MRWQGGFALAVVVLALIGDAHADPLQRIVDRPLTLNDGQLGVYLSLTRVGAYRRPYRRDMRTVYVPPPTNWIGTNFATLGFGYGINDELTIAGQLDVGTPVTSAAYDPFTGHVALEHSLDATATVFGAYRLAYAPGYAAAATLSVVQEVNPNLSGIGAGITARYQLTRRIAVFTGSNPIAPSNSTKLFFRNDGRKSLSAAAGVELQWTRRFYMNFLVDSSYELSDSSYRVSLTFLTLVTIMRNVDVGAFMGPYDVGLETHITM